MATQQDFYQHPNPYIAGKQTWQRATARYVHYERGAVSSPENAKGFFEQKYGAAFDFARLIRP